MFLASKHNNMRQRILFLHTDLGVGGAQRMRLTVLCGIDRSKYDIRICCLNRKGEFGARAENLGFKVDTLGLSDRLYSLITTFRLFHYIRKNKFHIVHSSLFHANFHARIAAKLAGVPVIVSEEHGECYHYKGLKFMPYRLADRILAVFTDKIICCSQKMNETLRSLEDIPSVKTKVIMNSVNEDDLGITLPKDKVRSGLGVPCDHFIIGTVGALSAYKAQHVLLRAFQELGKRYPKTTLLLVGAGPLKPDLERLAQALGIRERVIFTGERQDVANLLNIMDVFALSSMSEDFPISLLEAMYLGIPSVAPRKGGVSEVLTDGQTGYTFSYPDHLELAAAIEELLKNRESAQRMARKAREKIIANFLSRHYIIKLDNLYGDLLAKKNFNRGAA